MTSITIILSEDRLAKLGEIAARLNVTPEDLARIGIEQLLTRPDEAFTQAAEYVLQKELRPISATGLVRHLSVNEVLELHGQIISH